MAGQQGQQGPELVLKEAQRSKVFLKLNISGPSGSGKTMSALLMAFGITKDWTKIAVIDAENNSASLYEPILGKYKVIDLEPPFTPERYITAIEICIAAGIQVIIIDSSTHEWDGPGGCKDINERLAQSKYKGNTWSAWNETTPRHDSFISKVLQSRVHVITCTRSKMETVMGDDKKVKKVGMKDIQREGWEYELTVSLNLDRDTHTVTASKDRTNLFEGRDPFVITFKTGEEIKKWCETGVDFDLTASLQADIDSKAKKPITDKALNQAIDRYKKGEKDIFTTLLVTFRLNDSQTQTMNDVVAGVS